MAGNSGGTPGGDDVFTLRSEVRPADVDGIRSIIEASTKLSPEEIVATVAQVSEWVKAGSARGYYFLCAEREKSIVGFACFGPVQNTRGSFEIHVIGVATEFQGRGIGKKMLRELEERAEELGAQRIYIQLTSRASFEPAREFYRTGGFQEEAILTDYYSPGDGKIIYAKHLVGVQTQEQ
jgi:ribosomal protein S18 acetylase RimI-like enzyme